MYIYICVREYTINDETDNKWSDIYSSIGFQVMSLLVITEAIATRAVHPAIVAGDQVIIFLRKVTLDCDGVSGTKLPGGRKARRFATFTM